jgi:hypothetical protein
VFFSSFGPDAEGRRPLTGRRRIVAMASRSAWRGDRGVGLGGGRRCPGPGGWRGLPHGRRRCSCGGCP